MGRRTGIVAAMCTGLLVSLVGGAPVASGGDAGESLPATGENESPAPETSEPGTSAPEPRAVERQTHEVAAGVVVQHVPLQPGVTDVDVPAVDPPDWATAQSRQLAAAPPDVLTEAWSVDPFHLAAVTWTGDGEVVTWVRTRADGAWSEWYQIPADHDHRPDPGSTEAEDARQGTAPLLVDKSDAIQVRVSTAGDHEALPEDMRLDLTGADALPGDDVAHDTGTAPQSDIEPHGSPRPDMYTRADWGADESMRENPPDYGEVNGAFVHHTVSATSYSRSEVPAMLRSIYAYHVNGRGWNDVGYNFFVDRFGRMWEGRWGGADQAVIGAHTRGYNDDAFAMAALGTYTSTSPSSEMIWSYQRLFAWKFTHHGVDPRHPVYYDGDRFDAVSGHRDASATECPGDALYARLDTINDGVIRRMALEPSRDVNQDMRPDLLLTKSDGSLWYAPGRASGRFGSPIKIMGTGWNWRRLPVVAGDMMGNRYDELLAIRTTNGDLVRYQGGRDGSFISPTVLGTGWDDISTMAVPGDTDGDGARDIVALGESDGYLLWYPGTSGGGYGEPRVLNRAWGHVDLLTAAGDWNRDGHNDLVARDGDSGNLWLVAGRGDGTFYSSNIMSSGWTGLDVVGTGDMNADGLPDLVARKADGALWLYQGDGDGSFKDVVRLNAGWGGYRLF